MDKELRVLIIEDVPRDAELEIRELKRAGLRVSHRVVETEQTFRDALRDFQPELIISDFAMPHFDGMHALALVRELAPDVPFLFVSGTIGEEYAIRALQQGATDYVLKSNLVRLPAAVERALREARDAVGRRRAEAQLQIQSAALDAAVNAIVITDRDGTIRWVNRAFSTLTGYSAAEAVGQNPRMLKSGRHGPEFYRRIFETVLGGSVWQGEIVNRYKDGRLVTEEMTITPVRDKGGTITNFIAIKQDISARKEAEKQRERLSAILEASPDFVATADPDGKVLYYNSAARRMLELPEDIDPSQVRIADTHPRWAADLVLKTGIPSAIRDGVWSGESAFLARSGREIPVSQVILAHKGPDGNLEFLSTIARDISERKRAERDQAWLAAIVASSNDAIFTRALDGTILSWNASAERMMGYTAAEAIGKPVALTLPPDRPPNLARNNEMLQGGEVVARESDRMTKDGRVIQVLASHSAVRDSAGNIIGASAILTDISALKQVERALRDSEERFRAAFEQAGVGIALRSIDPRNSRWLRVNQKLCEILGYTQEELLQITSVDVTPPEDRNEAIFRNEQLLRGEIASYSREKRYVRKDGNIIWANISLAAVRGVDGKPSHVVSVIEDVTARKVSERRRAMEYAVTQVLAESNTVDEAMPLRSEERRVGKECRL